MGHSIKYTGRPLKQAHSQHPIKGGHFDRRKKILQETLNEFDVPSALKVIGSRIPMRFEHRLRKTEKANAMLWRLGSMP